MKIIVVGGGKIGNSLTQLLAKEKRDVILVERDKNLAEDLAEKLDALVICGDGSDRKILKDANINSADAVVAATGDDKTNLMICELAKSVNVPTIVTRLNDSSNESIFSKLGISGIINTTSSAILAFKKVLEVPGKKLISVIGGDKAEIFDLTISEKSKFANQLVGEAAKNFVIAAISRDGEIIMPKIGTKIQEGDILTICAPTEEIKKIEKMV